MAREQRVPASIETEQALLGAILLGSSADSAASVADEALPMIEPALFYQPQHQIILKAIRAVWARGHGVDSALVLDELEAMGKAGEVGGATYLARLGSSVPSIGNWRGYLHNLREQALRRRYDELLLMARAHNIEGQDTQRDKALTELEAVRAEAAAMIEGTEGRQGRASVVVLADVQTQETRWLWQPYIPLDCITILEGDPKTGKTWAALAIAAAITRGFPLPGEDGKPVERMPGNVLYLTAEDSLSMTLRPRLEKGNADLRRVHVLEGKIEGGKTVVPVTMQDLDVLAQALEQYKPVLMVIDPLAAFLGPNVNSNRFEQVRPVLAGITRLAEVYGCAVLLIRHLSKGAKDRAIYKGQGSIDFTAAARSVLMVGKDPNDPTKRVMVHNLCNVAKEGPAQSFVITDEGKLEWAGVSEVTGDELVAPVVVDAEERGSRAEAKEFLLKNLADGRQLATAMEDARRAHDIADRTLKRARKDLNVQVYREGRVWYWELPTYHKETATR